MCTQNDIDNDVGRAGGSVRQTWSRPAEFFLSCVAMSVGLGEMEELAYIHNNKAKTFFRISLFLSPFLSCRKRLEVGSN